MSETTPPAVWYSDARRGYENGFSIVPDFMDEAVGATSEFLDNADSAFDGWPAA